MLCKKLTLARDCNDVGELDKRYMPDFESCIGGAPVIDMELVCEQP